MLARFKMTSLSTTIVFVCYVNIDMNEALDIDDVAYHVNSFQPLVKTISAQNLGFVVL